MIRSLMILVGLVSFLARPVFSTVINIPDDFSSIQEGIDVSADGDTVLVQPGTYVENINFNGHNIVLGSLFLIDGDTSYVSTTIMQSADEDFVVRFENGEDSGAIIAGFNIKNGPDEEPPGGGIGCMGYSSPIIDHNFIWGYSDTIEGSGITCSEYSNPVISNNVIVDNEAHYIGGGISCAFYSSPVIISNIITDNSAGCGGGIYCRENSNPVIDNNIISDNVAYGRLPFYAYGGAIYCDDSSPEISDNIITRNIAYLSGGGIACEFGGNPVISDNIIGKNGAFGGAGIYFAACDPTILGNLISRNYASDWGGGVRCDLCNVTFSHNTVYGNSAAGGGGIHCYGSSMMITNTIFWADSAAEGNEISAGNCTPIVAYSDIEGGWEGENNIDCDPMFCDSENEDFHLDASSCCVGAGEEGSDIGAFGIGCGQPVPTLSQWGMIILALVLLATGTMAIIGRRKGVSRLRR